MRARYCSNSTSRAAAAGAVAVLSGLLVTIGFADTGGPPGIPKGGVETGRGMAPGASSVSGGRLGKGADGNQIVYMPWICWRLYMKPTDNVDVQLTFNCWQHCLKETRGHIHSAACSLQSCCQQDDNMEHKGEITSSSRQEFESNIAEALKVTTKVIDKMTTELHAGFKKAGVEVGGSIKREQTWSQETVSNISKSVREMFARSNSGTVSIRTGHFCLEPCSERQRGYGTRDWEIHLAWQIFEQPYKPTGGWVIGAGGIGGMIPEGNLKLAGDPVWSGDPHDDLIGTVKIPSDAPLFERPIPYKCPCDNPVETPGGGSKTTDGSDDKHSLRPPDAPGGQAVVTVDTAPIDRVVIHNPYSVPMIVTNIETMATVTVDPQQKKRLDDNWRTVGVAAGGAAICTLIPGKSGGNPSIQAPKNIVNQAASQFGNSPVKLGKNLVTDAPQPFNRPFEFPAAEKPALHVDFGGMRTNRLPGGGSVSPVVKVSDLPPGATLELKPCNANDGPMPQIATLATVESPDGSAKETVMQLTAPIASGQQARALVLTARSSSGLVLGEQELQFTSADLRAQIVPPTGSPGSPAQLVIDYRDWLRAMQMERPAFDATRNNLKLDFSQSGGSQGPASLPMESTGISRARITRGTISGSFPLGIKVQPRK